MLIGPNKIKSIQLKDKETDELILFIDDGDIQFLQDKYKCFIEEYPMPDMSNAVAKTNDLLQDNNGALFLVTYADSYFFTAHSINLQNGQFQEKPYRTYPNNKKIKTLKAMGLSPFKGA